MLGNKKWIYRDSIKIKLGLVYNARKNDLRTRIIHNVNLFLKVFPENRDRHDFASLCKRFLILELKKDNQANLPNFTNR